MLNFKKNDLINATINEYTNTFAQLNDKVSVPENAKNFIRKYILKCEKKAFKEIDKQDKYFQRLYRRAWRKVRKEVVLAEVRDILSGCPDEIEEDTDNDNPTNNAVDFFEEIEKDNE